MQVRRVGRSLVWTMTSPAVRPTGLASTVIACAGLMGSAETTLQVPRLGGERGIVDLNSPAGVDEGEASL